MTLHPIEKKALEYALDLIKRGRCSGAMAQDENHCVIGWDSPEACTFCLVGALYVAAYHYQIARFNFVRTASQLLFPKLDQKNTIHGIINFLTTFNDNTSHTEVLTVFEGAMERV